MRDDKATGLGHVENATVGDDSSKAFGLEVALAAAEGSSSANVLDTLACCYFMNGMTEKALATIDRCIELQPDNADWKKRRTEFETKN